MVQDHLPYGPGAAGPAPGPYIEAKISKKLDDGGSIRYK